MEIQEYKPGDENEILKLFQKTFGKSMSKEYWNWRFLQNSYSSKPLIHLMWDGDNLVGHYALSPVMFKINEDFHLGALSMTTMTDPDYNGRGIFTTLANSLYSEIVEKHKFDFVYGFPNNNSHRGFIKNLRWKDIEIIPSFSVLNPKQISGLKSQSSDFQLLENLKENNIIRYNNLIEDYNIYQFKNLDYINWRYIQNPIHKYYILGNSDYDFVIYKIFKNSDSIEIDIVEWCIPDDFDKVVSVLNSILKECDKGIKKINLWIPLKDKRHLDLERIGFSYTLPVTYLGFLDLKNINLELNSYSWYYQMGDSDVY